MIEILIWIVVFVFCLAVLIKSSDLFVESAEKIGNYFKIPHIIIGVTIVALGTSLPELVSSIFAGISGSSEIVASNVIGSNIANIFLVIGMSALISKKLSVKSSEINIDLLFLIGSVVFLGLTIFDQVFIWIEGLFMIAAMVFYFVYIIKSHKKIDDVNSEKSKSVLIDSLKIILFCILIFVSAKFTIEAVVNLSTLFNIGTDIIAATAVALGTSLPELIVSITAARKGNSAISIGNILGSNLFNTFIVMGVPSLISPLVISTNALMFQFPIMIIATTLFAIMIKKDRFSKWDGGLLVAFYIFFVLNMIGAF